MMPMPPACAMAIAIGASVTVSMAEATIGMLREILRVIRLRTSTSEGITSDRPGLISTSSKVKPSRGLCCEPFRESLLIAIATSACAPRWAGLMRAYRKRRAEGEMQHRARAFARGRLLDRKGPAFGFAAVPTLSPLGFTDG